LYQNLSILCVEDEKGVREPIVNTLKYYFGNVYEASDGQEGLNVYQENRPDIILCDIQMPVMDGLEMIRQIRKEDSTTPIVLLTAYNNEEYLMELINLHVQHFILKPINSKNLEEGIANALKGRHTGSVKLTKNSFLDIDNSCLHVEDKDIALSLREVKFLALLCENRLISYDEIEVELWSEKVMSLDALKSFVRDLRKKLPYEMIENIPQVGYKLLHT
jgi:DNA-binding response OmpR family regulator